MDVLYLKLFILFIVSSFLFRLISSSAFAVLLFLDWLLSSTEIKKKKVDSQEKNTVKSWRSQGQSNPSDIQTYSIETPETYFFVLLFFALLPSFHCAGHHLTSGCMPNEKLLLWCGFSIWTCRTQCPASQSAADISRRHHQPLTQQDYLYS